MSEEQEYGTVMSFGDVVILRVINWLIAHKELWSSLTLESNELYQVVPDAYSEVLSDEDLVKLVGRFPDILQLPSEMGHTVADHVRTAIRVATEGQVFEWLTPQLNTSAV